MRRPPVHVGGCKVKQLPLEVTLLDRFSSADREKQGSKTAKKILRRIMKVNLQVLCK